MVHSLVGLNYCCDQGPVLECLLMEFARILIITDTLLDSIDLSSVVLNCPAGGFLP